MTPIIVALDGLSQTSILALLDSLDPKTLRVKVGKESFTRFGPSLIEAIHKRGFDVFLDLKFHDIPNTVAKACKAACDLGVWMLNVHASGGLGMLEAARDAVNAYGDKKPLLIAVTVLTSLDEAALQAMNIPLNPAQWAEKLALQVARAECDGVVCSAKEVSAIKNQHPNFICVTPGIRPAGNDVGDQKRVMTPEQAIQAGADYLVIGRPITQSANPSESAVNICAALDVHKN